MVRLHGGDVHDRYNICLNHSVASSSYSFIYCIVISWNLTLIACSIHFRFCFVYSFVNLPFCNYILINLKHQFIYEHLILNLFTCSLICLKMKKKEMFLPKRAKMIGLEKAIVATYFHTPTHPT